MEIRKAGEKFTQQENDCGSIDNFDEERATGIAAFNSLSERQRNRHAYYEEKEWENQISWRPSIPLSVLERPIDMRPRAGIVDEHHAGDCETAKDVERDQAIALLSHFYLRNLRTIHRCGAGTTRVPNPNSSGFGSVEVASYLRSASSMARL